MTHRIRIGIIGAGRYTQRMLIPSLVASDRFEVVAICNRTETSAAAVAASLGVRSSTTRWLDLIEADWIDAVLIGTPPAEHHDAAVGALVVGKHVLCQTRIAPDLGTARSMAAAAGASSAVAMLVPPDPYLKGRRFVSEMLAAGELGAVRQVFCTRSTSSVVDSSMPLLPRQDPKMFGVVNPLHLGLCWDVLGGWFGSPRRVVAHSTIFTRERRDAATNQTVQVELADAVTAIAEMPDGTVIHNIQSGVAPAGDDKIVVHGERATLVYQADETLWLAPAGSPLRPVEIPSELECHERTATTFAELIDGGEVGHMSFADGVNNLEYLTACYVSASEQRWVDLSEIVSDGYHDPSRRDGHRRSRDE